MGGGGGYIKMWNGYIYIYSSIVLINYYFVIIYRVNKISNHKFLVILTMEECHVHNHATVKSPL